MTTLREAAQQALEFIKATNASSSFWFVPESNLNKTVKALRAALEQPEQEPVAWCTFDGEGGYDYRTYDDNENYRDEWDRRNPNHKGWVEPLYTHPPRREWRGLTEEEIKTLAWNGFLIGEGIWDEDTKEDLLAFSRAIESALKEKNNE